MRVTTNMMMKNYQTRLNDSLTQQTKNQYQVMTGRRYQYAWEEPSDAMNASNLTKRYLRNKDYLETIDDVQSYQDAQEDACRQVSELAKTINKEYSMEALNGTTGLESRKTFAAALREIQNSMVNSLNGKYGDDFVLSGSDGKKLPFEIDDNGNVLYHGIDVDDMTKKTELDAQANQTLYVDLGFGLTFDQNQQIVSSSAFNTSLPGIAVVGYGKDANNMSNNMIVLVGQMAEELEKEDFDQDAYEALWMKFDEGANKLNDTVATLGTKTQLLTATKERLTDLDLSLQEQLDNSVNIDPAEAIMNYSWAQYAYNAALRVGTNILSPSLLDFIQ